MKTLEIIVTLGLGVAGLYDEARTTADRGTVGKSATWGCMSPLELAAFLALVVVLASMISVEVGISVALLELGLGVVAGNLLDLDANTDWLVFVASFASIVLTFLAGAEVDPDDFRERFGASVTIGLVSFIGPFVVAALAAYGLLGWTVKAALIAGTALSTTSLAVVYAVLVETGLNTTRIGKLLMSACFVTDLGTALALSAIFITPNAWFPVFLLVSIGLVVGLPWCSPTAPTAMPCCRPSCSVGDEPPLPESSPTGSTRASSTARSSRFW